MNNPLQSKRCRYAADLIGQAALALGSSGGDPERSGQSNHILAATVEQVPNTLPRDAEKSADLDERISLVPQALRLATVFLGASLLAAVVAFVRSHRHEIYAFLALFCHTRRNCLFTLYVFTGHP